MDLLAYTEDYLAKLKYVHLQKLAHKHNIKKRWAKKEELVHCLLSAKAALLQNEGISDNLKNEEVEWMDGASFPGIMPPPKEEVENDKIRGTFTIEKFNDSRATYDLTDVINDILPDLNGSMNERLTFDVPKTKDNSLSAINMKMGPISVNEKKKTAAARSQVKMLTIPYSPVVSRVTPSKTGTIKKSIHQLSNKSITIKKAKGAPSPIKLGSKVVPGSRLIHPVLAHSTASTRFCGRIATATAKGINTQVKELKNDKQGPVLSSVDAPVSIPERRLSTRRKSKSDDPEMRRNVERNMTGAFRTPPSKSQAPASSQKTNGKLTVSKMPDFAKIHEKQFKKMDSLDEYINKKADRVKKLFGTPLLLRPTDKVLKPQNHRVLHGVKEEPTVKKHILLNPTPVKDNVLNARKMMNRNPILRTQTDVKDKNRSHIHGIRTNKRFELQMKFRNL